MLRKDRDDRVASIGKEKEKSNKVKEARAKHYKNYPMNPYRTHPMSRGQESIQKTNSSNRQIRLLLPANKKETIVMVARIVRMIVAKIG